MFERFRRRRLNREIVDRLYEGVVARARRPVFFEAGGLPDTVMGRFDAVAIEMFLLLRRCRAQAPLAALSQELVDRFMTDMDHSMREIGIGYQAVPRRMRKLAGLFYQRVGAFGPPLDAGDRGALATAVLGERLGAADLSTAEADFWSDHMLAASADYAGIADDEILAGRLPVPQEILAGHLPVPQEILAGRLPVPHTGKGE